MMLSFSNNALLFRFFILVASVIKTIATTDLEDSWPKQYAPNEPMNDRYLQFMQGCYQTYGKPLCDANERDRIALNYHQPAFQTNFTSAGYAKVRLSDAAFVLLQDFWDLHYHPDDDDDKQQHLRTEAWSRGSIYVNHWEASTKLLPLEDTEMGMNAADLTFLQQEVQSVLSRWSHQTTLTPTSLYGIRVYQKGSILAPHVDRLPLVLSAIINVAQDVEEDWPLELIGHDGMVVNLTMQPGDMILYESHSVLHGRPYPLHGTYFANVFVHFEPVFYTMNLERDVRNTKNRSQHDETATLREKYEQALAQWDNFQQDDAKVIRTPSLPLHIREGTLEATRWRQEFAFVKEDVQKKSQQSTKQKNDGNQMQNIHRLAARGALDSIQALAETNPAVLHQRDANDWQMIHEAARAGQTKVVEYLVRKGVDLNTRTNHGSGGTPLWWAERMLPSHHKTIKLLRDNGAVSIAPGAKTKSEKLE